MILPFLANLGFAGGGAAVVLVTAQDLTTRLSEHLDYLHTHGANPDYSTALAEDIPTVRATESIVDLNTAYFHYLGTHN